METPSVVSIFLKRRHGAAMESVSSAELVAGRGIAGNADQGGRRQITIIDEAAWRDAAAELGVNVDPSLRRANVLLRGIDLRNSRGRLLRIGTCRIRIFGETRPCQLMDEGHAGLRNALRPHWRAGVFGEILEGGTIRPGDDAEWLDGQLRLPVS